LKTKLLIAMFLSLWVIYANTQNNENDIYMNAKQFPVVENIDYQVEKEIDYEIENKIDNSNSNFTCDGREYCSQMTSCAEATYFIRHCPNTKMDGNNDGVPCERQWCSR